MPPHIVIVEDAPQIAKILIAKLQREGYAVTWVDAQDKIGLEEPPALAIVDATLEASLDGLALISRLRGVPGWEATPLLVMLEQDEREHEAAALQAGAAGIIRKPFKPTLVAAYLHTLVPPSAASTT